MKKFGAREKCWVDFFRFLCFLFTLVMPLFCSHFVSVLLFPSSFSSKTLFLVGYSLTHSQRISFYIYMNLILLAFTVSQMSSNT
jgi:hypothetical protein